MGRSKPIDVATRGLDAAQKRFGPTAFIFGVVKKFGDDQGGNLAAVLTYNGFVSLWPLLLVFVTLLSVIAEGSSSIEHRVLSSALAQFPVIGVHLSTSFRTLHRNSVGALVIGIAGLICGAMGVCQSGQYALAQVWNIPRADRPGFAARLARSLLLFAAGGLFLAAGATLASVGVAGHGLLAVSTGVGSGVLNVVMLIVTLRILTPKAIQTRALLPGAITAGVAWSALQLGGGYLVSDQLRHMSQLYGLFAIALGTLWWIYLTARITIYAAEVNVVLARHLWPRGLRQPPSPMPTSAPW